VKLEAEAYPRGVPTSFRAVGGSRLVVKGYQHQEMRNRNKQS
jgi:hypothetical protein